MPSTSRYLALAGILLLAACASKPEDIGAAHVSTREYEGMTCEELREELEEVNSRARKLETSLEKTADADQAQMAVGMLLFWPTLFFLEGGDGPEAAEYARLKGEREAIDRAIRRRRNQTDEDC